MIDDKRYRRDLADGQAFERYVIDVFADLGIDLDPCETLADQLAIGDTRDGREIKLDRNYARTGNLFVETEERPTERHRWKPAGIYAAANPRWFLIGDHRQIWQFATAQLRALVEQRPGLRRVRTPTAAGVLVPVALAGATCARRITVGVDGPVVRLPERKGRAA